MQSATIVQGVSFRQEPRPGQLEVWENEALTTASINSLNIKLPTGYGKTYTACGVYSILQHLGRAQRVLYIVPSDGQLKQFEKQAPHYFALSGVKGTDKVTDLRLIPEKQVLNRHRRGECQCFVVTVQSAIQSYGRNMLSRLLETGQWLIVVDEYHHYGTEKAWGEVVNALPRAFLLAMSATPQRKGDDSAFGEPTVRVTYKAAKEHQAVKPLIGHAYDYKIDTIKEDGTPVTYTTAELIAAVGSEQPERIEKFRIEQKMRWSPKYVSPLVRIPIQRMQVERIRSGYRLQALVSCLCVSHAELVCGQLRALFPEIEIDWVGTGENGRTPDDNEAVLQRFCPPSRDVKPTLDVLVHVGMAGEGLDAILVSEVVMLRMASLSNQTLQIIGRASRYLKDVEANVSFDRSTMLAMKNYVGHNIEYAMDADLPKEKQKDTDGDNDVPELPDEPNIQIVNMDLIGIDSGDAGVQRLAKVFETRNIAGIDYAAMKDLSHPEWGKVVSLYMAWQKKEAEAFDERAAIALWRSAVEGGVGQLTHLVIRLSNRNGVRIEKSLVGDIKKRINSRKKASCGEISNDVEICKLHWQWIKSIEKELRTTQKVPSWLS